MVDYEYLDHHSERISRRREEETASYSDYLSEQAALREELATTRGCPERAEVVARMFENIYKHIKEG